MVRNTPFSSLLLHPHNDKIESLYSQYYCLSIVKRSEMIFSTLKAQQEAGRGVREKVEGTD